MARRIALVVSADSGPDLLSGRLDAVRVYSLLTDEELGCCDPTSPMPVVGCATRAQFHDTWDALMQGWTPQDQLLFYFSGHGVMKHGKYALAFGPPSAQQYLPFDHIASDLQAHGVRRAVLILDACYSGVVVHDGAKDGTVHAPKLEQQLPEGIVVLASCRESERSFEFEDGAGSVFTHLLTLGIRSGLDGKPTEDNLIGADDLVDYVNARLCDPVYAAYPQRPTYRVSSADRTVWIARNKARAAVPSQPEKRARTVSLEELRFLYERTERSRHPCAGAALECLDWALVETYAQASQTPLDAGEARDAAARRLGLYSTLAEGTLHNAAVLCFARAPHALVQQARSIYIRGERTSSQVGRVDVLGPLSNQVRQLTDLVMTDVFRRMGWRPNDEGAKLLAETVREAISNAVTHRDYASSELVRVAFKDDIIEISNPGRFPNGTTFESLMFGGSYSAPTDAAIAWYLTTLLAYEGVGRGFSVYKAFREAAGSDAIQCSAEAARGSLKLVIRTPTILSFARAPEAVSAAARPSNDTLLGIGKEQSVARASVSASTEQMAVRTATEELVGGRYRLGPQIGAGGSGTVFLAEDIKLSRQVALKILPKRFVTEEVRARFMREATLAARIGHPGIVQVYDLGDEADRLFIVMELVSGLAFEELVEKSSRLRESSPDDFFLEATWLIHDIAEALAAAHANLVIHRDIKPGNIIIDDTGRPRILDFGISQTDEMDPSQARLTVTGVLIGTPFYMSPEQVQGRPADARSDVFSLGVVMYELLCQKRPFDGATIPALIVNIVQGRIAPLRDIAGAVPIELQRICLKALERDIDQRYGSASQMALDLRNYAQTNPRYGSLSQDRASLWRSFRARLEAN